ncbi:MAG TPA: glutathionylspermidine synthase family protein [Beijerinckiaceae bacterium]
MQRRPMPVRPDLDERARSLGFTFHRLDGAVYWDENAAYVFTLREIENDLEAPTAELAAMCLELADRIVASEELMRRLKVPEHAWDLIAASWRRRDLSLYGRFDLAYSGEGPAKLLEYNADTPTSLYEAAVFQWFWLEDLKRTGVLPAEADQFNALHERLIERLRAISAGLPLMLHFACMRESAEDRGTVEYLRDCAMQADLRTKHLGIADVGLRGDVFVDLEGERIRRLFKLYPWEWMLAEPFGRAKAMRHTRFLEPPWKAVLSTKGILPLLWELAPGHPNLLPAYFEDDPRRSGLGAQVVRKPLYSREGANVEIRDGTAVAASTGGTYGAEGHVLQALAPLRAFDGNIPVIGSWIVGDAACGIGIREDTSPITGDGSRFVPHVILG